MRDRLISICLLMLLVLLLFNICNRAGKLVEETFSVHSVTKEEITDERILPVAC